MKRHQLLFMLALLVGLAHAQPQGVRAEFRPDSPAGVLQQGMGKLLRYVATEPDPKRLRAYLERDIVPYFDFEYMAQSAAGRHYQRLNSEQKHALQVAIKNDFLATLVRHLANYNRQQVRILQQRYTPNGRNATVSTAIIGARGYPARLDFRFYKTVNGWKVFDVVANGQSAIVHYRRWFHRGMLPAAYALPPGGKGLAPFVAR